MTQPDPSPSSRRPDLEVSEVTEGGVSCRFCTSPRSPIEHGICRDCYEDGTATR